MIDFRFILNPDTDNLEIEEPQGFSDIELSIIRDEKTHGIGFEASTSSLKFYGEAFFFLKDQKETNGLKSNVVFQALTKCEGQEEYEEILRGKLNFAKYKETCGDECTVSIPIEQEGCQLTFKNRYDQKVDIEATKSFNGLISLPDYAGLNFDLELPPKAILVSSEGNVANEGDDVEFEFDALDISGLTIWSLRPTYGNTRFETVKTTQLSAPSSIIGFDQEVVSPIVLYEDNPKCFDGEYNIEMRAKGYIDVSVTGNESAADINLFFVKCKGSYITEPLTTLNQQVLASGEEFNSTPERMNFDLSYSGTITLEEGDCIYVVITGVHYANVLQFHPIISCHFEKETYFKLEGISLCQSTENEVSFIHETLSRVAEFNTDYCVRVKSSYYGRFDSEPFSFDTDGCGGLRVLTSGLKIRKAIEDKFFVSMKELIEGLNAIDNIGMDFINDPERIGKQLLRIEDVGFFYKDAELISLDSIPESGTEVEESRHLSKIKVGYKKWEVEKVNGLDEINSNREYHTSLSTVSNELDIQSNLVAGSYAIEVTRQQSFAESGGADTTYDNETFIICLKRSEYPYGNVEVEQGNIINPDNIYSPDTLYNYRISPVRNLMRWYKSIAPSYPNISDSDNKLYFGSGTANIVAEGEMESTDCKIEKTSAGYDEGVIKENQDIFTTHFQNSNDYTPIWKNDLSPFVYPLSVKDYNKIKENPYGYISFQCGNGDFEKGWIKEIKFKPVKGEATFILRKKW